MVYINKIKKTLKEAKSFVAKKQAKEAQGMLPKVYEVLDKAAKVGIIKKNNASRHKSRMAKMVAKISK